MRNQHGKNELTQSVLEGVAYAFSDCQNVLIDAETQINEVSLIGGGSRSDLWAQIIASVLERPMIRYENSEMGPAMGAARLAILATNRGTIKEICKSRPVKEIIEPNRNHISEYRDRQERYRRLYNKFEDEFKK